MAQTDAPVAAGPAAGSHDDHRHHLSRRLLIAGSVFVAVVMALLFARAWLGAGDQISTDDALLESDLAPVSARVAGYVRSVPAEDFQAVRAGDVLVVQDDRDYRAQLAKAEADLATARAMLASLGAQRQVLLANVGAAQGTLAATAATFTKNSREQQRQSRLIADGVGSQQLLDQAEANMDQNAAQLRQNRAQVDAAHSQLGVLAAQTEQARAGVQAAQANLDLARLNLAYTRIVAPVDGVLGVRQVRPGQYVPVGGQVFTLAPRAVWVIANFKETQLTRAAVGQPATITVDTFPGHRLKGRVVAFAPAAGAKFALIPPDNASGNFTKIVQRIAVKISLTDLDGLQGRLRAGMSVTARIDTGAPPEGAR